MGSVFFGAEIFVNLTLIRFTDICLRLSLTIIFAKYDTTLDDLMIRPVI